MNKTYNAFNSPTFLSLAAYNCAIASYIIFCNCIVAMAESKQLGFRLQNSSLAGDEYNGFENYEKRLSKR